MGGAAASYSMSITVKWDEFSTEPEQTIERSLTIAFSLVQDRLYIKADESNLEAKTVIPSVVYVPPVAGVDSREEFATLPKRRAMLGRGLAGSVLRNYLYDLQKASNLEKDRLRSAKGGKKLNSAETKRFRETDPWERLNSFARETFGFELSIHPFDTNFHSILRVNIQPKVRAGNNWRNSGVSRDLMVEGSGAQQWLTVLTFALSPDTNVLLLDEPDAHLFTALKLELVDILKKISASKNGPQILLATHSTEILKRHSVGEILNFGEKKPKFLSDDVQRAKLISGLGDDYSDLIEKARASRALIFVENESDCKILKDLSNTCGRPWPENVAILATTDKHSDRLKIYKSLCGAIDGLKSVSIRDRDDSPINSVDPATLKDGGCNNNNYPDFFPLTWRRREIENYALNPDALRKKVDSVVLETWWKKQGWAWPWNPASDGIFTHCDVKRNLDELLGKNQTKPFLRQLDKEHIHGDILIAVERIFQIF